MQSAGDILNANLKKKLIITFEIRKILREIMKVVKRLYRIFYFAYVIRCHHILPIEKDPPRIESSGEHKK